MTKYDLVEHKEARVQGRRAMKNLVVFCVSFFFQHAALNSLVNLQSTLNHQDNIGVTSLLVSWIVNPISGLLLPNLLLKFFNYKWIIVFCQSGFMAFVVANMFPSYLTLIPSSVMLGISAAILWTYQGSFISLLGSQYSKATGRSLELVMVKFFGMFMIIFQLNQILGNSISYLVLKADRSNNTSLNTTSNLTCGLEFAPIQTEQNIVPVDRAQVLLLCSIFLGFCIFGNLLVLFFLDNIKPVQRLGACESITQTLKILINPKNILMLPLAANFAMLTTFIVVDVTKAYIACSYGIHTVGYFFAVWGVSSSLYSLIINQILKLTGRYITLSLSIIVQSFISMYLALVWNPSDPLHYYAMFGLAVLLGVCESTFGIVQNTIVGTIFKPNEQNAAFSANRVCFGILFTIPFFYSSILGMKVKIIMVISGQIVALLSYTTLEILLKKDFFN